MTVKQKFRQYAFGFAKVIKNEIMEIQLLWM